MKKVILATAFIGLGTFAFAQQASATPEQKAQWQAKKADMQKNRELRRQQHLDAMQKDLNLNASQVAQIRALEEKNQAEHDAKRQEKMREMHDKNKQHDAQMKSILNEEQYAKWQAAKDERLKNRKEKFQQGKLHRDGKTMQKMP